MLKKISRLYITKELHELLRMFLRFKIKIFYLDFKLLIKLDFSYFFYLDKVF